MESCLARIRVVLFLSICGLIACGGVTRVVAEDAIPAAVGARAEAIHRAAQSGDIARVKALLAADPALVNIPDTVAGAVIPGGTPLHTAVFWHQPEIIALLLADKADINGKDQLGRRPLHIAVRYENADLVSLLLADGADVNAPDDRGRTPLREALVDEYVDIAKLLRDHQAKPDIFTAAALGQADIAAAFLGAHPELVGARDDRGQTPLHWAARYGQAETAKNLLSIASVNVNAKDAVGNTPLHWAVVGGEDIKNTVSMLLIAHGADLNARNAEKDTPLLASLAGPHATFARDLLIARGTDVTLHGKNGRTALHYAGLSDPTDRRTKSYDDLLLARGADVNARDDFGQTPLHLAASSDSSVWAAYLLSHGARINLPDHNGATALHLAVQADRRNVAAVLLAAQGVAVNARDVQGRTPLYIASERGYTGMAALLLAARADVNARSRDGTTPLDAAILAGHKEAWDQNGRKSVADLLLSKGATLDIFSAAFYGKTDRVAAFLKADPALVNVSHEGTTPLHLAADQGFIPLVQLLLAHGADVNGLSGAATSKPLRMTRMTPLMLAAERGSMEIVKLLLAYGADTHAFAPNTYAADASQLAAMFHHGEVAALIQQQNLKK